MRFRGIFLSGAAALLTSVILAACTVVVDEGPDYRPPPPPPGPQFCTREYAPVCGQRGPSLRTFPNSCEANRVGYRIVSRGECRGDGGWGPGPTQPPQICTREYRPVCATRRGDVRTFPNACEARAANWGIVGNGPC
jgi:hypothetical protein